MSSQATHTVFCPLFSLVLLYFLPTPLPGKTFSFGRCCSDNETACMEHPCLVRKPAFGGSFLAGWAGRMVTQIISVCMRERSAWHLQLATWWVVCHMALPSTLPGSYLACRQGRSLAVSRISLWLVVWCLPLKQVVRLLISECLYDTMKRSTISKLAETVL